MLSIIFIIGGSIISVLFGRFLFCLVENVIRKIFDKADLSVGNIFIKSLRQTFFIEK